MADMQEARTYFCVASHAGKLWAIGNCHYQGKKILDVEEYDPQLDKWSYVQTPMKLFENPVATCSYSFKDFDQN